MKKTKLLSLITLFVVMIASLIVTACGGEVGVKEIKIDESTYKSVYFVDDVIDYSKIQVKVIFDDESEKVYKLTDSEVTYTPVDTSTEGNKELKITISGKEITLSVQIVKKVSSIKPVRFTIPQSYVEFKNASAVKEESLIGETEFAIKGKPYVVGNVNKFKFLPIVQYIDPNAGMVDIENPITTYELQLKGENGYEDVEEITYISEASNNMYKFTTEAEGKEFKLIVKLDGEAYDLSGNVSSSISIEFKVEKAYNAYDIYGLSVVDNLNVKNWAKIKDRTLEYDDKKLSEYTDVTLVVLHNDIAVDADKLPNNYFWSEYMTGYDMALQNAQYADNASGGAVSFASKLKGSLRDGTGNGDAYSHTANYNNSASLNTYDEDGDGVKENYAEDWNCVNMQKGIFNTDQCSISGNYMSITAKDSETRKLSVVICNDYKTDDNKKMFNPISHWSMFKFYKTGEEELNINVENVFIQGNMPKVNEGGIPAGIMCMNTLTDAITLDNVITSQFYTHIVNDAKDGAQSVLNFKNSRMFDAYSNMIYLWRSNVSIENSIMKNAGGPLFILCDAERAVGDNTSPVPVINVDDKSILESYAAGTEAWYNIFDATLLFNQFKGMNQLFMNMQQLYALQGIPTALACNKTFVHQVNGAEQINLIAVVIPTPETITSARSNDDLISIKGRVTRGTDVFDICDPVVEVVKGLGSVSFVSNGQYAFMPSTESIAPFSALANMGVPTAENVPGNFNESSDWLAVTMSAASLGVSNAPYFNVIIGNFEKI